MKIVVVDNPKSGSALSRGDVKKMCGDTDITVEKFITIGDGFDKKLAPFVKRGALIAAIGGDGTVSAVAGLVAGSKATLIPLPGGTLNHFTKDLGIPQDIEEAISRLTKLKVRRIDIARVNDQTFINNSSLGLYPASLKEREKLEGGIGKWPAAVTASFRALVRFKAYQLTIKGNALSSPFVFVGNNRYSIEGPGGTLRTKLDEGVLTVFVAHTKSRTTLLKIALFALVGKTKRLTEFDEFYVPDVTISTKRANLHVSHDGEISTLNAPLKYRIDKKALRILA